MIKTLNYEKIPEYASIVLAGKRRSGKGVLTRDLVKNVISRKKIRNAFLFSPTSNIAKNPMNFIPEQNRFLELDLEILHGIMKYQEEIIKEDPNGNHAILICIDDIVGSINNKQKNILNTIFILGRHLQIYLIYCVQSVKNEFTPTQRQNTDMIFIFNQSNFYNKEQLSLEYLSMSMDKKTGIKLIDTIAIDHQALVILNTDKSGSIENYIFKYTAEYPIKDFSLKF